MNDWVELSELVQMCGNTGCVLSYARAHWSRTGRMNRLARPHLGLAFDSNDIAQYDVCRNQAIEFLRSVGEHAWANRLTTYSVILYTGMGGSAGPG